MTGTTTPPAETTAPPVAPDSQEPPAAPMGGRTHDSKVANETVDPGAVLPDDPEAQNDLA